MYADGLCRKEKKNVTVDVCQLGVRLIIKARKDINTTGSAAPPAYTRPDPTNKKEKDNENKHGGKSNPPFPVSSAISVGGGGDDVKRSAKRTTRKKKSERVEKRQIIITEKKEKETKSTAAK
jgi:hypothetical protein